MRIINPDNRPKHTSEILELKSIMENKHVMDFSLIRKESNTFKELTDGEIHQIATDAGFIVE